jgi:3-oxoadipate enol-lactonase
VLYPRLPVSTIHSNGVDIYYERAGAGEPLLFVHGFLFSAESFRHQMDALAARYDVVGIDLRGQHRSTVSADQAAYDLWNQAEDVHGVIEGLGIGPCHYVGLSMGGMIGMRLYARHPGDIRSFVFMDTSHEPEPDHAAAMNEAFCQVIEQGGIEELIPATPPIWYSEAFIRDHFDVVEAWQDRWRAADPMGFVRALRAVSSRDDVTDVVRGIAVPTLVIHGREDAPIKLDVAVRLAEAIPGARLEVVEDAGHMSCIDQAEATTALISGFLDGVGAEAAHA